MESGHTFLFFFYPSLTLHVYSYASLIETNGTAFDGWKKVTGCEILVLLLLHNKLRTLEYLEYTCLMEHFNTNIHTDECFPYTAKVDILMLSFFLFPLSIVLDLATKLNNK